MTPAADRSGRLAALRGVAALMVCFHHTGSVFGRPPVVVYGYAGVYLFFVLSGYLLVGPFVAAAWGDRPRPSATTASGGRPASGRRTLWRSC